MSFSFSLVFLPVIVLPVLLIEVHPLHAALTQAGVLLAKGNKWLDCLDKDKEVIVASFPNGLKEVKIGR